MCAQGPTTLDDGKTVEREFIFNDADEKIEDSWRLQQLRDSGLLTARHRPGLDVITRMAAEVTEGHTATVVLVEVDRQVSPSHHGGEDRQEAPDETPISQSICQYIVMNDAPLVVEDARTHPVLSSHPAVLDGAVVAFAGFPVHAPGGEVLGALCVVDVVPRSWAPAHLAGLADLATTVDTKIALRLSRREFHLEHERLQHILDGAAHTLIIVADADGHIRTTNHAAEVALGPAIEVLGTTLLSDPKGVRRPWEPEDGLDDDQDWTFTHPQGEQRVYSVRVSILHDSEGEVDGYIVVGDDVSEQRKSGELRGDIERKQAEATRRIAALEARHNSFITTASHEFRTPLTNILGFTELLCDGAGGDLTPDQHDLIGVVVRNGLRLQRLIEDLLSFNEIESDHDLVRTEVDVRQLMEQAWASVQCHLTGRSLRTSVDLPSDIPAVAGDLELLDRALVNLLTNAIKFTPDGGAVRLSVQAEPQGVRFEVSDTGLGIPQDDHKAVFEPFFRTEAADSGAAQGAGVGLAVVRRIVESHESQVVLTSVVGEGTEVRFTLPFSTPDHQTDWSPPTPRPVQEPGEGVRVPDIDASGDHRLTIDAAEAASTASQDALTTAHLAAETTVSAQEAADIADVVTQGVRSAIDSTVAVAALAAAEVAARAATRVEADAALRALEVAAAAAHAMETAACDASTLAHPLEAKRMAAAVAADVAAAVVTQTLLTDKAASRVADAVGLAAAQAASAAVTAASVVEAAAGAADTTSHEVVDSSASAEVASRIGVQSAGRAAKLALKRVARLPEAPMTLELQRALEEEELRLHFQPMYDMRTGTIEGIEALIRWQHPVRGLLHPADFLDVAEGPHLVTPIGDWVLSAAVAQAIEWHQDIGNQPFTMWVNISSDQLGRQHFVGVVERLLVDSGLPPSSLGIEVTERQFARRVDAVTDDLSELHDLGVGLAIDDFGTGYASLDYLRRFDFDAIKIDTSFVSGPRNRTSTAVTASIIAVARSLDLTVVAEGVETQAQFDRLRTLGCDLAQGHLLHRPAAAEIITATLRKDQYS